VPPTDYEKGRLKVKYGLFVSREFCIDTQNSKSRPFETAFDNVARQKSGEAHIISVY
jgi:hypothetical protein